MATSNNKRICLSRQTFVEDTLDQVTAMSAADLESGLWGRFAASPQRQQVLSCRLCSLSSQAVIGKHSCCHTLFGTVALERKGVPIQAELVNFK